MDSLIRRQEPSSTAHAAPVVDEFVHLRKDVAAASAVSRPSLFVGITHSVFLSQVVTPEGVVSDDFVQDYR